MNHHTLHNPTESVFNSPNPNTQFNSDFTRFLTFLQNNQALSSLMPTNIHSLSCQNKPMPNCKELFPFCAENGTTYMNNSVDDTVKQKHQDTASFLTNFLPNSNNYTRDRMKSGYLVNQQDHALYSHLKSIITQPNQFDTLRSFPSPVTSSTSVTTLPPITSSSSTLLLLWLSRLNEIIYGNSQELKDSNCFYKTLTNLLSDTSSHFSNDGHISIINHSNSYLDSANIQNQTKRHAYFYSNTNDDQEQIKNYALTPRIATTNHCKVLSPPNTTYSKICGDNKSLSCNNQLKDVYNRNCRTNRERHQEELNYVPSSFLTSSVFPFSNSSMDRRITKEDPTELNCHHDKKCAVQLDEMCTVDPIVYNATSKFDILSNRKNSTHLSESSLAFSRDTATNFINSGDNDHKKSSTEYHLNKCVRLINGEMKVREELSVSDFISSAIKYDNFNKFMYDNGPLIEALASTNNLELCWVKLIQIKNDSNTTTTTTANLSSELTFVHSSKRHHLLVGKNGKNCSKQASRMLWPHFNAKSFNVSYIDV
ncbi:unnamed protein product [Schistosoma turkestanicum]|nr:unnamed protein product [Schistosoma turkestanicum]